MLHSLSQPDSATSSRAASEASFEEKGKTRGGKMRRSRSDDDFFSKEMARIEERRRERDERRASREERQLLDEDAMFAQQIACIFKRLPAADKYCGRIQILELLQNIEFPPAPPTYCSQQYEF